MFNYLKRELAQRIRTDIYQVTDQQQWALYWVAHYVAEYLRDRYQRRAYVVNSIWDIKGQILHFVAREAFINGPNESLHPSNHVFLTWLHGHPDDPDPALQQLFEKLPGVLPRVQKIVTSCTASKEALLSQGVPAQQIEVIPLGVDLRLFIPPAAGERQQIRRDLGIPDEAFCIGSFQKDGTGWGEGLEPKLIKGPDVFLETIAQLARQHPRLMVLLTGPARGYIKNGLDKIGVPYVHRLLEHYHQIAACYHALDAYLITSRSEGGPKGLMESWATGVPVVSTRMGMPADWIRHGENGLLAENGDSRALADQMMRLIEDVDLRGALALAGVESVKPLDWAQIAGQYDHLLYAPILD